MKTAYDVFVSYSRKDEAFVKRLVSDLKQHHIKVWLDSLEIKVGEQFRRRIEDGIEHSRFFCFVISDASLKSYFAREVELEAAFLKMTRDHKKEFVLPLNLGHRGKLPLQLGTYQYLDFSSSKMYKQNAKRLADRILMTDTRFTGTRLHKNVDTTMTGTMVGVGEPLKQIAFRGSCVRVFFEDGRIRFMETYTDSKADGAKSVSYDDKGRVSEIALFRNNAVIDTWRYEYDRRGLRKYKWVSNPGEPAHVRLSYDKHGNKTEEAWVDAKRAVVMGKESWAIRRYVRNEEGKVIRHDYLDSRARLLRSELVS